MTSTLPEVASPGGTDASTSTTHSQAAVGVELRGVTRRFGQTVALRGLDLSIKPGEMVALLGPSGCGKTTALRALAGLEDIDEGEILVGGRDVANVPASKRDMAMVFQSYSLFPHLTVAQNVAFPLSLRRGISAKERNTRVPEYLELVGLGGFGERYPNELSGGQQQRVALARALAVQPKVLLLDEPLSALDAKVRVQLRDEIRRIQLEVGITTVFVTHDQEEALAVADRVAVMRGGIIEQLGEPEAIYSTPENAFVADFIGHHSRVRASAEGGVATVLGQRVPLLAGSAEGAVEVLLRPEHVSFAVADSRLAADESGASGTVSAEVSVGGPSASTGVDADDALPAGEALARVVSTGFLGAHVVVQARLADGTLLRAHMRSRDTGALEPGSVVAVDVHPAPALAVPAGQ
ncbi:spermidine/putrescine ABC transporter ATP-binding protein [Pseudoclavibacter sp. RFBI5]|uniref:ABC transporter ATP-binding protein n=1 Tax=Pseudoclavibacter sp. RFBI5 TaxID=2080578 RepID=UPI000CE8161F|nr:ABC transporter ATP-binding protein [Pseudoclavibacter sp. RFBI5]PPG05608.1 spermidine/putrescine ABC transporter ATP-binding protein [Pseudoclavibacter sp. RFBI5]